MKQEILLNDFDRQYWKAEKADLAAIDPRLASQILFNTLLINEFEHALLRFKKR